MPRVGSAGGVGGALAWDGDRLHAGVEQGGLDAGFAVAAVRGRGPWSTTGAAGDPFDRGWQLRGVGWVALLDCVVQDDAVGVVDDLSLVAELNGFAEASLDDRAAIGAWRLTRRVAESGLLPARRMHA
nr:hypothetical protein GCM10020063_085160 [Dactylosporangium thailandense]